MRLNKLSPEAISLKGKKPVNEDTYFMDLENSIFILADGATGYQGQYASRESVALVHRELMYELPRIDSRASSFELLKIMEDIFEMGNLKMLQKAERKKAERIPSTTLDVVVLRNGECYYAHIGDSRIYVETKEGPTEQLTRDDSEVQIKVDNGKLTPDQAKTSKDYQKLVRCIGSENFDKEKIQTGFIEPKRIIMTTDGLTDICSESELNYLLTRYKGKKLLKQAEKLYKNPVEIYDLHMEYDAKLILEILNSQTQKGLEELQRMIVKGNDPQKQFEEARNYLMQNKQAKEIMMEKIKQQIDLSERDNFTMITIEEKGFLL